MAAMWWCACASEPAELSESATVDAFAARGGGSSASQGKGDDRSGDDRSSDDHGSGGDGCAGPSDASSDDDSRSGDDGSSDDDSRSGDDGSSDDGSSDDGSSDDDSRSGDDDSGGGCDPGDPDDADGDGIPDVADNCPDVANPGQEDSEIVRPATGQSVVVRGAVGTVRFRCGQVDVTSSKKALSNVVVAYADGTHVKKEGLTGTTGTFGDGRTIVTVWVKAGNNASGDGPGYGERFDNPDPAACAAVTGDGVGDACDVCPDVADLYQDDTDGDGVGDACECADVVCEPVDACWGPSTCDPRDGQCTAPEVLDDGAACGDGDTCIGGTCRDDVVEVPGGVEDGEDIGETTLVTLGPDGFVCLDRVDPSNPTLVGRWPAAGEVVPDGTSCGSVVELDGDFFVACGAAGIFQVSADCITIGHVDAECVHLATDGADLFAVVGDEVRNYGSGGSGGSGGYSVIGSASGGFAGIAAAGGGVWGTGGFGYGGWGTGGGALGGGGGFGSGVGIAGGGGWFAVAYGTGGLAFYDGRPGRGGRLLFHGPGNTWGVSIDLRTQTLACVHIDPFTGRAYQLLLDVSDPEHPVVLSRTDLGELPNGVSSLDDAGAVLLGLDGLLAITPTPPSITGTDHAGGAYGACPDASPVTFRANGALVAASIGDGAVSVVDAAGVVKAGHVTALPEGDGWRFHPATAWAVGSYTATRGASPALGVNGTVMSPFSETFTFSSVCATGLVAPTTVVSGDAFFAWFGIQGTAAFTDAAVRVSTSPDPGNAFAAIDEVPASGSPFLGLGALLTAPDTGAPLVLWLTPVATVDGQALIGASVPVRVLPPPDCYGIGMGGCLRGDCAYDASWLPTCDCPDAFTGAQCETPVCADCENGDCAVGPSDVPYCDCHPGFAGAACDTCAPGVFGPGCAGTCGDCGNGVCDDGRAGDGSCTCDPGYAGATCAECVIGAFGPECATCPECGAHGACDDGIAGLGTCACDPGFSGAACDDCEPGVYGPACAGTCPACGPHGTCDDGIGGAGTCTCDPGWTGTDCATPVGPSRSCSVEFQSQSWGSVMTVSLSGFGTGWKTLTYRWDRQHTITQVDQNNAFFGFRNFDRTGVDGWRVELNHYPLNPFGQVFLDVANATTQPYQYVFDGVACTGGTPPPTCDASCEHGVCVPGEPDTCDCHDDWTGADCTIYVPPSSCDAVCINGDCVEEGVVDACLCDDGWTGDDCGEPEACPTPDPATCFDARDFGGIGDAFVEACGPDCATCQSPECSACAAGDEAACEACQEDLEASTCCDVCLSAWCEWRVTGDQGFPHLQVAYAGLTPPLEAGLALDWGYPNGTAYWIDPQGATGDLGSFFYGAPAPGTTRHRFTVSPTAAAGAWDFGLDSGGPYPGDPTNVTLDRDLSGPAPAMTCTQAACIAVPEICGDGVDQDCDGSDAACPSGTVYDGQAGGTPTPLPGALVTYTSATGTALATTRTNSGGSWTLAQVPPQGGTVTFTAPPIALPPILPPDLFVAQTHPVGELPASVVLERKPGRAALGCSASWSGLALTVAWQNLGPAGVLTWTDTGIYTLRSANPRFTGTATQIFPFNTFGAFEGAYTFQFASTATAGAVTVNLTAAPSPSNIRLNGIACN